MTYTKNSNSRNAERRLAQLANSLLMRRAINERGMIMKKLTREKAIKELNSRIELANRMYVGLVPEYIEDLELAVEALRKQDPMKPIHKEKNFYCPNCDHWLLWDDAIPNEWDNYCAICGQKIDWTGVQNDH